MTGRKAADRPAGLGVLGAGAAVCAACCAGPVVGFLAATGIASVLGAAVFGVFGLLAVLVTAAVWHRRRTRRCAPPAGPVRVDAPGRRTETAAPG